MEITRATTQATKKASADYFGGDVYQDPIVTAPAPARVRAICVSFMPGGRTNWHTHPLGQTLYVISGVGRVQKKGEPVREIRPGDSVWIAPGEVHWHGAASDHAMTHVAIQEADDDGKHIEWLEPVSEADYTQEPA